MNRFTRTCTLSFLLYYSATSSPTSLTQLFFSTLSYLHVHILKCKPKEKRNICIFGCKKDKNAHE